MEIRKVPCAEILDPRNAALLDAYAEECSIPAIGRITPQADMYEAMEKSGMFHCFGAYENYRLVGFASMLTTIYPHYGEKAATVESIFAEPESGAGAELIEAVNAFAKESGCEAILYSAPTGGRFERLLVAMKDCTRTNSVFCRRVA